MRHNPANMVLKEADNRRMLFAFQSKRWGTITLLLGAGMLVLCYVLAVKTQWLGAGVFTLFAALLLYSAVYSFVGRQTLELDKSLGTIKYTYTGLHAPIEWTKSAKDFREVCVSKPRITGAGKAINYTIALIPLDGEPLTLGYSAFGAFTHQSAITLARQVADAAGVRVVDQTRALATK